MILQSSHNMCSFPLPSQQRVFLWRVFVLLLHWACPVRQTRPDRRIPGCLPPRPGPRQTQDMEEPMETLLPQTQEGRVRDRRCSLTVLHTLNEADTEGFTAEACRSSYQRIFITLTVSYQGQYHVKADSHPNRIKHQGLQLIPWKTSKSNKYLKRENKLHFCDVFAKQMHRFL